MKIFLALTIGLLLTAGALAQDSAETDNVALAARGAQALRQQMRDPDSLQILKVVVTTRSHKDSSAVDVCYQYRVNTNGAKGRTDHDMAVYSSANGKEKLKFGALFLHNSQAECNFSAKVAGKTKVTSSDITAAFEKQTVGENVSQVN